MNITLQDFLNKAYGYYGLTIYWEYVISENPGQGFPSAQYVQRTDVCNEVDAIDFVAHDPKMNAIYNCQVESFSIEPSPHYMRRPVLEVKIDWDGKTGLQEKGAAS